MLFYVQINFLSLRARGVLKHKEWTFDQSPTMFDHEIGSNNEISYPKTHGPASLTWAKTAASRPKVSGLEPSAGTSQTVAEKLGGHWQNPNRNRLASRWARIEQRRKAY